MNSKSTMMTLGLGALAVACAVEDRTELTGGVELDGATTGIRGFAVVGSDFTSSSISLLGPDGQVQSSGFISSGSSAPGLSAALGGDIALPSTAPPGDELVLIDRFPASVLTWVNLETAEVRTQLSVATGYASNPSDYVPYSASKAFVPRFEPNLMSGAEPFDAGDDVLIVDPTRAAIVGRIDLTPAFAGSPPGIHPRAGRAFLAGGSLRVLAVGLNTDFTDSVDSRLISIDPETEGIEHVLVFEGMKGCGSAALSPEGAELAVACSGAFGQDPAGGFPDAGVLLIRVTGEALELDRWTASSLGIGPLNRLAWTGDDRLALLTFGRFSADGSAVEAPDEARTLSLRDAQVSPPWLSAGPFNLGDIACSPADGVCLVTDAETAGGVLQVLALEPGGAVSVTGTVKPDAASGLPPRAIGTF